MGRGTKYAWWRRALDGVAYRTYSGGWAARAAYSLGLQGSLDVDRRSVAVPSSFRGSLKIAFASDFHAGPLTDPRLFDDVFAAIRAFEPDMVFLGGDYVSFSQEHIGDLLSRVVHLTPPLGLFAVLGNHDLWLEDATIHARLREAGADVLVNETRRVDTPAGSVLIYGMDEPGTGQPQAPPDSGEGADLRLLLMHSPLGLRHVDGFAFHAAFLGHTHGGQIALPGGIPVVLPRGCRSHARGLIDVPSNGPLLVSRGVGLSQVPVRLFADSEVHLCTIHPKE